MKTKITIIGIMIIIAVAVIVVVIITSNIKSVSMGNTSTSTSSGANIPLPPPYQYEPSGETGTSSVSTVTTSSNTTIETLDFMNSSSTIEDSNNKGYYFLGYQPALSTSSPASPYLIGYIRSTNFFNITLLQEPIGDTRSKMERDLMARLGITEAQACALNYMVSVPYWVNEYYSGINLGFSFCPGATTLPQ